MTDSALSGLIGGIGMTEVTVYAQHRAPDGLYSGCPHIHAVTDEGYFVLQGTGAVEFHDLVHGYRRLELKPGHYAHFPPLIMHRLISDGDLVILGIMGNAGLAERGEARIYFGPQVDVDTDRYNEAMALPKKLGLDGALQRRDLAVTGYQTLLNLWKNDREGYDHELRRFFAKHAETMSSRAGMLTEQVQKGPIAWAQATSSRIAQLPAIPAASSEVFFNTRGTESAFGMCGVLRPILSLERMP
jgi:mannose-6-phosphate isomerase-like protein (cupin superfamily)